MKISQILIIMFCVFVPTFTGCANHAPQASQESCYQACGVLNEYCAEESYEECLSWCDETYVTLEIDNKAEYVEMCFECIWGPSSCNVHFDAKVECGMCDELFN